MKKFKLIYLLIFLMTISFGCKKGDLPFAPEMPEVVEPEPAPTGDAPTIRMWTTDRDNHRMKLHTKAKSDRDGEYLKLKLEWNTHFQNNDYDPSDGLAVETCEWILLDDYTYTANAENKWGTTSESFVVGEEDDDDDEDDSLPIIDYFRANPLTIQKGDSSELSWKTRIADSVEIDNGIGFVNSSGTHLVFPEMTTTYILTAKNEYGTKQNNVTITVTDLPPQTIDVEVCTVSELLPSEWCEHTEIRTYDVGTEPTDICDVCTEPEGEANVIIKEYDWDFDFYNPNPNGRVAELTVVVTNDGEAVAYNVHVYVRLYYKNGELFSERVGEVPVALQPYNNNPYSMNFRWTYGSGEIDPFINDEINLSPEFDITWD